MAVQGPLGAAARAEVLHQEGDEHVGRGEGALLGSTRGPSGPLDARLMPALEAASAHLRALKGRVRHTRRACGRPSVAAHSAATRVSIPMSQTAASTCEAARQRQDGNVSGRLSSSVGGPFLSEERGCGTRRQDSSVIPQRGPSGVEGAHAVQEHGASEHHQGAFQLPRRQGGVPLTGAGLAPSPKGCGTLMSRPPHHLWGGLMFALRRGRSSSAGCPQLLRLLMWSTAPRRNMRRTAICATSQPSFTDVAYPSTSRGRRRGCLCISETHSALETPRHSCLARCSTPAWPCALAGAWPGPLPLTGC